MWLILWFNFGSNFRIQKGYKILLCVLYKQDSDLYGMWRHRWLPSLCICGNYFIFTLFFPQWFIYNFNKMLWKDNLISYYFFQAVNIHGSTRISAFGILAGIKTIAGLFGTLVARFLPIALTFQVHFWFFITNIKTNSLN